MTRFVVAETLNRSIDYPIVEEVLSVGYYSILMFLATFGTFNIMINKYNVKLYTTIHASVNITFYLTVASINYYYRLL